MDGPRLHRRRNGGFTLIELMVGVAILGILLALALPTFTDWLQNSAIRGQADYMLSGLQQARGEAIKRNRFVRFQLVTTMDGACDLAQTSHLWIVSHGDPQGQCDLPQSQALPANNDPNSLNPVLLIRGVQERRNLDIQTTIAVDTGGVVFDPEPVACFNGLGQLARIQTATGQCTDSRNPGASAAATLTLDVTPLGGVAACQANPATIDPDDSAAVEANNRLARCVRIVVLPSGETRMCDPVVNLPDPRACL